MLFMVIEHFKDRDAIPIYRRVKDEGRRPKGWLGWPTSIVAFSLWSAMIWGSSRGGLLIGTVTDTSISYRSSPPRRLKGW